jgi:hypothetical protein
MMRGQIWSMDLIFAVVIFSFTITILGVAWLHTSNGLSSTYGNSQGLIFIQAGAMSDTLLSAGTPTDWQSAVSTTNSLTWIGISPGIEAVSGQPQISAPKLYALMAMAATNYTATKPLFGIGNDYYIIIGSPGAGVANITIGRNPLASNASTIYINKRSAVLDGNPVWVQVMIWSNSTSGAG